MRIHHWISQRHVTEDSSDQNLVHVHDTTQARPIVPYPWLNPDYTDYVFYVRRPLQFSAYVLDKMELAKTFILNAGLRYEYYNTYADYNPDLAIRANNRSANLPKASAKQRLSPRLSLTYPITDRGIIRVSYGHFYQMPTTMANLTAGQKRGTIRCSDALCGQPFSATMPRRQTKKPIG